MKYAYFIIMHCLEQENRTSNKIVAAKSFYHTFLHYSIKLVLWNTWDMWLCTMYSFWDSDKRLSIAQTSDRRIPNFQSVEQSITSFDIFKSDFLDF